MYNYDMRNFNVSFWRGWETCTQVPYVLVQYLNHDMSNPRGKLVLSFWIGCGKERLKPPKMWFLTRMDILSVEVKSCTRILS